MSVHYPKGMVGKAKKKKLRLVTIAVGEDMTWQGGVSVDFQMDLLKMMQHAQETWPVASLDIESTYTTQVQTNGQEHGEKQEQIPQGVPNVKPTGTENKSGVHTAEKPDAKGSKGK